MQILIGGVFWRRRTLDPLLLLLLRIGITTVLLIGIINTNRTIVMGGCPLYSNPNQAEWVQVQVQNQSRQGSSYQNSSWSGSNHQLIVPRPLPPPQQQQQHRGWSDETDVPYEINQRADSDIPRRFFRNKHPT